MTTPSRIERNLPGILGDLSAAPTPDYLDDVFARVGVWGLHIGDQHLIQPCPRAGMNDAAEAHPI